MRDKHVAVAYDENGKCCLTTKVVTISEQDLNKLKNEENELKAKKLEKELKEKQELELRFEKLEEENLGLKLVISYILGFAELDETTTKEILGVDEDENQD